MTNILSFEKSGRRRAAREGAPDFQDVTLTFVGELNEGGVINFFSRADGMVFDNERQINPLHALVEDYNDSILNGSGPIGDFTVLSTIKINCGCREFDLKLKKYFGGYLEIETVY